MSNSIIKMNPNILLNNVSKTAAVIDVDTNSEKFKNMLQSISNNGQIEPVVMYNNKMYDGRHRSEVCKRLGIDVIVEVYSPEEYSEEEIIDIVFIKENMNKSLTSSQKTYIAYQNYVAGMKLSLQKAAIKSNIKRDDLAALKYISESLYAQTYKYVEQIKNGEALKLPNGKYSKSLRTIKGALLEYEKLEASKNDGSISDEQKFRDVVDYRIAFAEYDFDSVVEDVFWNLKEENNIYTYQSSCSLIYQLLKLYYNNKYDFTKEITLNKILKLCKT